jgi:hypothetical protein
MASTMRRMLLATLLAAIFGCASEPPVQSTLDDKGVTWSRTPALITLARSAPRFSAAARDYLYVAPMEANDTGNRRHYLWLGSASTVDRARSGATPTSGVALLIVVDGVPMALPLTQWEPDFGTPPHDAPAPIYSAQRAQVTLDQLERIANAQRMEVELVTDDGAALRYELWDGAWSQWHAFIIGVDESRTAFEEAPARLTAGALEHQYE